MNLANLKLQNFRSYKKIEFKFSQATTLLIGENAVGKTNLLEAIYLMATGKSFRADREMEMINWDEELARVKAEVNSGQSKTNLELMLTTGSVNGVHAPAKKYLVNGIARRQIDFIGNLRAVLFWPEDLELVTDSPSLRRKYLDSVLIQVDREYRRNLLSYEKGLRQRNRLLDLINEGKAARSQLMFWNQLLIRSGGYLTDKRQELLNFINFTKSTIHNYETEYDKSVISESRLAEYANEEIAAKATLVGPHRDDFLIKIQKNHSTKSLDLSKYGSRGEQRLAVLWLKLAELDFIQSTTNERPILLLDDIFSELDEEHRELVFGLLGRQQTIITSAEEEIAKLLVKQRVKAEIIRLP